MSNVSHPLEASKPFPSNPRGCTVLSAANWSYKHGKRMHIRTRTKSGALDMVAKIEAAGGVRMVSRDGTPSISSQGAAIFVDPTTKGGGIYSSGERGWALTVFV